MIKGVRIGGVGSALRFFDTLEVPIIENTPDEEDLTFGMSQGNMIFSAVLSQLIVYQAMEKYPDAPAILVRRHGVYVWGDPRAIH